MSAYDKMWCMKRRRWIWSVSVGQTMQILFLDDQEWRGKAVICWCPLTMWVCVESLKTAKREKWCCSFSSLSTKSCSACTKTEELLVKALLILICFFLCVLCVFKAFFHKYAVWKQIRCFLAFSSLIWIPVLWWKRNFEPKNCFSVWLYSRNLELYSLTDKEAVFVQINARAPSLV